MKLEKGWRIWRIEGDGLMVLKGRVPRFRYDLSEWSRMKGARVQE